MWYNPFSMKEPAPEEFHAAVTEHLARSHKDVSESSLSLPELRFATGIFPLPKSPPRRPVTTPPPTVNRTPFPGVQNTGRQVVVRETTIVKIIKSKETPWVVFAGIAASIKTIIESAIILGILPATAAAWAPAIAVIALVGALGAGAYRLYQLFGRTNEEAHA